MVIDFTDFLLVTSMIQLFYWLFFFSKLAIYKDISTPFRSNNGVSVVVCAKNDLNYIRNNMPKWLDQQGISHELLIVDDFSGIETQHFIEKMKAIHGCLSYYKVKTNLPGKKQALQEGMSVSSYSDILLTDADCEPNSNYWAKNMSSVAYSHKADIVLGYSPYKIIKKNLLHKWIHFEGWLTGVLYLSFALKGLPYMGVGRNLFYKKSIIPSSVFDDNNHVASGDDDLLINKLSNSKNTAICIHPDSFCTTMPKDTWKAYYAQKSRHYSTASFYKWHHKILLGVFSISLVLFYFLLIINMFTNPKMSLLIYLLRIVIMIPISFKLIKKLEGQFSLFELLIFDFLLFLYYLIFSFSVFIPNKKTW
ncbi:MAG: glycosyltransferase [Saprospiraceae bacterium]|nr:glycosyltransferase [Bacteroidia bacterium]NNL93798.1 glycosyltransferase [Saprospiraceae bacterium]